MIKNISYPIYAIEFADFQLDLCEKKEKLLKLLADSIPKKVKRISLKGSKFCLRNDFNNYMQLYINGAGLYTSDWSFCLYDFLAFLENLAFYDNKSLICCLENEGLYDVLLVIPQDKDNIRTIVVDCRNHRYYKIKTDIIIKKYTFLKQMKNYLDEIVKITTQQYQELQNNNINLIKYYLSVLESYFEDSEKFKKTYNIPKQVRVFDIAYKTPNGDWKFIVCLEDDKESDFEYWRKQKQDGKILDFDYKERYSISPYHFDENYKNRIFYTKEQIRNNLEIIMDDRVKKQDWFYSKETKKWYSTNEKTDFPIDNGYESFSEDCSVDVEVGTRYNCEKEEIESYIKNNSDLHCIIYITEFERKRIQIEFEYRQSKKIKKALEKVQRGEYVRFYLIEEESLMHIWHKGNDELRIIGYRPSYNYMNEEIFSFSIDKNKFLEGFINAINIVDHKIKVMKAKQGTNYEISENKRR